jgi:DNA-binding XRE family transcriptional regulator
MMETTEVRTFVMLRKSKGLTQGDVAKALAVTEDTVANWESGRSTPKFEIWQVKTLCDLLEVQISELPDSFVSPKTASA